MIEQWKPCPGWESHYEVSDRGNLRKIGGNLIGQYKNGHGYMLVRLRQPRVAIRVHRLVELAFIQNPENKPFINHIDCDRAHNLATNIEWCTQAENLAHARRLKRMPDNYWVGKRSPSAKLSDDDVMRVREMYSAGGWSLENLGEHLGISKRTVGRIILRQSYV